MCFMMFHVLQIHSITFHYTSLHVYLSLSIHPYFCPTFTYTIHTYTYSHLHTDFWAFCNFLRWAPRNHPAPEGSTTINQDQAMSTFIPCSSLRFPSHCQVLGSLGPCLLFHNGCLLPLKLLSFHVHRFRRTQCGNIAAKHWCASDFRNQS